MRVHGSGIYIAAILVGVLSGLICVAFRYTVATICSLRPHLFNHSNPLIAHLAVFSTIFIMLSATGWIVRRFPKASGSGLPQTQALLFGRRVYDKPFTYLLVKFAGGIFSLCSGLSLGREGTSVQMGSLTGYITASLLKLPPGKHRHLIAAGAGAGVSAAFTAPLSSSILIMESLQKVTITTTLICTLLAGGTASIIAKFITPGNIYDSIGVAMPANPQWQLMLLFVAMAIFFALMGRFFSTLLEKGKLIYARSGRSALFHNLLLASVTWTIGLFFTGMIGGD
ncbi:MAG: chloride channel protein, partial [Bacteroidales bacterium]|nr:chloride channel protein [Bacteroidales bacterium]